MEENNKELKKSAKSARRNKSRWTWKIFSRIKMKQQNINMKKISDVTGLSTKEIEELWDSWDSTILCCLNCLKVRKCIWKI